MKKIFTSLLLLVMGVMVCSAKSLTIGGTSINLSTSKTYTSSDIPALKSGSVEWNVNENELTLKNVTIDAGSSAGIYASGMGTSNQDRFYIYINGSATVKSTSGHGMRFDDCFVVLYGGSTAYLSVSTDGNSGYVGIDAESSNLSIWSIRLNISAPNSYGIWGNKNDGWLTFIGTYGDIKGKEAAVFGFKNLTLDDCLIDTNGGKFVSSTGITDRNGNLLTDLDIRPLLRVAGVSVRTAGDTKTGTNWKWTKSDKSLTITGDITASSNNDVIENYGIDGLTIKWEGSPTLKNGSTSSGSIIMSKKSMKFSGQGSDITKALNLAGYLPVFINTLEDNTLTINNATLTIDGAGYGIDSQNTNTNLVINQSSVLVRGQEHGSIAKMKSCKMTGCDVYTLLNPGVTYRQSLHGFGTATELFKGEDYLWILVTSTDYKIEVLGKPVTDVNMTDITVDGLTSGNIVYDPDSKTLSVTDIVMEAPSDNNEYGLFFSAFAHEDFVVKLQGTNTVTTNNDAIFSATGRNLTFTGTGNAHFISKNHNGMTDNGGGTIILDTENWLLFEGKEYGLWCSNRISHNLVMKKNDSKIYRFKGGIECMHNIHKLTIDGMDFYGGGDNLKGCYYDEENQAIRQNGCVAAKNGWVAFGKIYTLYDLIVAGVQVNNLNKYGVGSKYITSNNPTAVTYDPSMKVLTLNNAVINYYNETSSNFYTLKNAGVDDLTIMLEGDNSIITSDYIALEAAGYANTMIRGDGKLNAESSWYALRIDYSSTLDIGGNVEIDAHGISAGIANNMDGSNEEKLIIRGKALVKAQGSNSVQRLNEISLRDDIMLLEPVNATVKKGDTGWGVYVGDNLTNQQVVFGDKSKSAIEALELDPNADVKDVYDLSGRKAETARPGMNIIRMSDGTVRKVMMK